MIRYSVTNGNQIIKEICEHCGEIISDLHISEITVKNPKDPRTIKIVGKDGSTKQVVPTKEDFLATKTGSYIREGLLDDGEKPKYGVRPEAMCSQSIDIVTGITASFCYRTDNETFLSKTSGSTTFSASFHATSEKESTDLGRKVGVDRKGNIIRLKSEKNLDEADSAVKYHGQFQTSWFRVLSTKLQKSYLEDAQGCSRMLSTYGKEEVMSGKVMARFKTLDEFKTYMKKSCP